MKQIFPLLCALLLLAACGLLVLLNRSRQGLRTLLADGEVISTVCSFSRNEEKDGTEGNH